MAFLVMPGRDSSGAERTAELGAAIEALPLALAAPGQQIASGRVTIVPRGAALAIVAGCFTRAPGASSLASESPIDSLFEALAIDQTEHAAGVVLAGGGGDGAFGLRAIRENGGVTFAEAPGAGDVVLPWASIAAFGESVRRADEIPPLLAEYFARRASFEQTLSAGGAHGQTLDRLPEIRALLAAATGLPFGDYEEDALMRRIARRMSILGIETGAALLARLESDPRELDILSRDLLISVSNFFREPRAFAALARDVVPRLFERKSSGVPLRVWVPGCASGEEAYSIAILLEEERERRAHPQEIQIFATDLKESALEIARLGRYPASIARDVSARRLARYFKHEAGAYQIAEHLRRMCVFSVRDLLCDMPFSEIDLISCRNILVYFQRRAQDRVFALFHQALGAGGYLFLGAPDASPRDPRFFTTVNEPHRIFRRRTPLGDRAGALVPSAPRGLPSDPARG